ncbi:MAG: endonuclease/exonuclease/phosphatase family protein [Hyphomonadaceae bacterium]
MTIRVVNWNIERRGPHTWQAASLISEIADLHPDLVCLTEAHEVSLDALGGHVISHVGYRSAHKKPSERLVLLWSSAPWQPLVIPESLQYLGGLIGGVTNLDGQEMLCIGLCIPYHMAKLASEEKTRPWHHHKTFLKQVAPWLRTQIGERPIIVVGDFNQRIPRKYGSREAYDLLMQALDPFEIITRGELAPLGELTIDHIGLNGGFRAARIEARSRFGHDGRPRSDHFGIFAEVTQ